MPTYSEFIQMFDREIEYREKELARLKASRQVLLSGAPKKQKKAPAEASNGHTPSTPPKGKGEYSHALSIPILEFIKAHPGATGSEIARGLNFSGAGMIRVYGPLEAMRNRSQVNIEGSAPKFRYFPVEAVPA